MVNEDKKKEIRFFFFADEIASGKIKLLQGF
jgi:hypothetical protein